MSLKFLRLGCEARGTKGVKPKFILFFYLFFWNPNSSSYFFLLNSNLNF